MAIPKTDFDKYMFFRSYAFFLKGRKNQLEELTLEQDLEIKQLRQKVNDEKQRYNGVEKRASKLKAQNVLLEADRDSLKIALRTSKRVHY